ncbi:MAG: LysR family transcriptional regulator, partial [Gemmataceae bacterium]|nr:LysR family transcriptional regulator [Gemmataceae bacterium]
LAVHDRRRPGQAPATLPRTSKVMTDYPMTPATLPPTSALPPATVALIKDMLAVPCVDKLNLEILQLVARAGSVRSAAIKMEVHPTTVRRHIQDLGDSLGVALLETLRRGTRITPSGWAVLALMSPSVQQRDVAQARV